MKVIKSNQGFSFVEILVTIAIVSLFFGGIFGTAQLIIKLVGQSKATSGALALANERMEYIRSLPYNQVGTIGSPPYGLIPQNSTSTINGFLYNERVLITYIDAEADGLGAADINSIIDDYKLVKIEYTWDDEGVTDSISLISTVVPPGIETTTGGGTIKVNVFDASINPVSGAEVHIVNNTLATTTDTIRYTNAAGVAFLSGAPEGGDYEITVTKAGYSTDGTYVASSSNPNPITAPVAVVESAVSTMNFQIDLESDLKIETWGVLTTQDFVDLFDDATNLATTSFTTVSAGALELSESSPGVFESNGTALGNTITPGSLQSWLEVSFVASTTANNEVLVSLYYDNGGTMTLVPDIDLSNNSSGFNVSPIDISGLSDSTYPGLALGATLSTTDTSETPRVLDWRLTHVSSQSPIGSLDFNLSGQKTIGTDAGAQPVYKYSQDLSTSGAGELQLYDMEWDLYNFTLNTGAYDIAEICQPTPFNLSPGVSDLLRVTLEPSSTYALRVVVVDSSNNNIHGADVNLTRGAIDQTISSSACGQSFFNTGLVSATDYSLTVSKPGYTTFNDAAFTIENSTTTTKVILN